MSSSTLSKTGGEARVRELFDPESLAPLVSGLLRLDVRFAARLRDVRVERCWPAAGGGFRFEWSFQLGEGRRQSIHAVPRLKDESELRGENGVRITRAGVRDLYAELPQFDLLVHSPDRDPRMPQMGECFGARFMADGTLAPIAKQRVKGRTTRLLGYKAGRRAAFLYRAAGGRGKKAIIGKTFRDGRAAQLIERQRRIVELIGSHSDERVRVAQPLAVEANLRMALLGWLEGRTLDECPDERDSLAAIDALAALHRCRLDRLTPFTIDDECAIAQRWAEGLRGFDARLAGQAADLAGELCGAARDIPPPASTTIHRDFYEKQVVIHDDYVGILDLDTVAVGDPAQDVGNFLAHRYLARLASGDARPDWQGARNAVLERYHRRGGRCDARAATFYAASSLVRGGALHALRSASRDVTPAMWRMAVSLLVSLKGRKQAFVEVTA